MEPRKEKVSIARTPAVRWALAGGMALWTAIGFFSLSRAHPLPGSASLPEVFSRGALTGGLALWTAIGFIPLSRPDPLPASAPLTEFSAGRAMTAVRAIAQRPHPVGSADHDRVREYVLGEFTRLGVPPRVQAGIGTFLRYQGKAENILARLPGTFNTRPVMLAAHYDSTRRGPGAGDDAQGVAVLLETLRALRQSAPLRNDVIF